MLVMQEHLTGACPAMDCQQQPLPGAKGNQQGIGYALHDGIPDAVLIMRLAHGKHLPCWWSQVNTLLTMKLT